MIILYCDNDENGLALQQTQRKQQK